jgi:hypothetical protein
MKLKSFGCSFIFGTDLSDAVSKPGTVIPSEYTWPAHLSRHLGYKYECYARPGAGNLQIAEQVLCHVANNDFSLFVIGWTWIDRFDYWSDHVNWIDNSKWETITPADPAEIAKIYYRDLHSEYRDKLTNLMTIKLVIDTLNNKKIPFVMTYMDTLLFDRDWHVSPAVIELQDFIKPCMTTFDGGTLLEFSQQQGFDFSATMHPLETAHRAAFETIKSYNLL